MWTHPPTRNPQRRNPMSDTENRNNAADGGLRLTPCSPSSEVDTAPEQWRSQCLVARIQRDEALKSAEHAKAYKRVMKLDNQKMKRKLAAAMNVISAIEERYVDGCDTYEDWKFMGDAARAFLSANA